MFSAIYKKLLLVLGIPLAVWTLSACSSSDDSLAEAEKADAAKSSLLEQAEAQALHNVLFHGREIYLRGEMNDYGVQSPYRLRQFSEKRYCTLALLRSDWSPYRFKFADAHWTVGTNFGYAVPPAVMREGSARTKLNPNSRFEELRYEPSVDGIYRFCIEYDDNDVPYASVTYLENGKLHTMDELIKSEIERTFSSSK